MQIDNPLQLNDWGIRKFLTVIAGIQLIMLALVGLQGLGIDVPVIRQAVGVIYLSVIPGFLLLRILRLHRLGAIESLLCAVGLSISFQMFLGLLVNSLLPHAGISTPLSLASLTAAQTIAIVVLSLLSYIRDRDFSNATKLDIGEALSPPALFLILLIALAVLGTFLVNIYMNSLVLLVVIASIALLPVLAIFTKFIPARLYPLAIFSIGLSLLLHRSLISAYLVGWDIHTEYYVAKLVESNGYWDPKAAYSVGNSLLSLTVLPSIYAKFTNMEMTWVFKIVYPLLVSVVPLGLYRLFRKWHDEKVAFLSVFFFVSMIFFFTSLVALARQEIAEVFLVLLLLLILDDKISLARRALLIIVFDASIVVSHYAISYIYGFYIFFGWFLAVVIRKYVAYGTAPKSGNRNLSRLLITIPEVAVLLIMAYAWYLQVTQGGAFTVLVGVGSHVYASILDFFNLSSRDFEVQMFLGGSPVLPSFEREVFRYISYITQAFIAIGVIVSLLELMIHKKTRYEPEYLAMVVLSLVILGATVALPFFASSLGMTRFYHLTLFFLAPFCIVGGQQTLKGMAKLLHIRSGLPMGSPFYLKALLIVLVLNFLFNAGFVYEVTGDNPISISLGMAHMRASEHPIIQLGISNDYIFVQESASAEWLAKKMNDSSKIFADNTDKTHVLISRSLIIWEIGNRASDLLDNSVLEEGSYVYLGHMNVTLGLAPYLPSIIHRPGDLYNVFESLPALAKKDKIYSNRGSEIYK